jgi:hypothetical protein
MYRSPIFFMVAYELSQLKEIAEDALLKTRNETFHQKYGEHSLQNDSGG